MEKKNNKADNNRTAKAPLADEKHQLEPSVTGQTENQDEEPGKLPKDELGVDHHSDPVTSKTQ